MISKLHPHLPFIGDETPLSFATRLAAFHTGGALVPFLKDRGMDPLALAGGRPAALEALATCSGVAVEALARNAIKQLGERRYRLREEQVSAEFLNGNRTAFCPACLFEDDQGGRNSAALRRGRFVWHLRIFRTCPLHGSALVHREKVFWSDILHELSLRVPERAGELQRLSEQQPRRDASPLQDYVADRLDGQVGPAWLNGQTLEQVVRATEMVGAVLEFGTEANLSKLSENDWDRAGRIGFEFTAQGEEGLHEAFNSIRARLRGVSANGGPQIVFGKLFKWLQFARSSKNPGPIKDVLREYIFNTMDIPEGGNILGQKLAERRRHSVASLTKESGLHPTTLKNLLISVGVISNEQGAAGGLVTFDAALGRDVAAKALRAATMVDLPKLLNCSRTRANLLVDAGLIQRINGKEARVKGYVSRAFDRDTISAFLEKLEERAEIVDVVPTGMLPLAEISQATHASVVTVVRLILAGKLTRLSKLKDTPGISGLLFDAEEIWKLTKSKTANDLTSVLAL